ncbi:MAG TPA: hypothetical protein VG937_33845 [Polyangiaceae bacterium]|jgi:hypothetical protein|nr:hypothetical protein [Polyangiaceae bacterium]
MQRGSSKLLIGCTALALGLLGAAANAHAQGPERSVPAAQPLEVWSRAMSGLGALELACQPALPPWRVRETVDPWAPKRTPCEPPQRERLEFVATAEIVDPWPARSDALRPSTREIIDPWAALRR